MYIHVYSCYYDQQLGPVEDNVNIMLISSPTKQIIFSGISHFVHFSVKVKVTFKLCYMYMNFTDDLPLNHCYISLIGTCEMHLIHSFYSSNHLLKTWWCHTWKRFPRCWYYVMHFHRSRMNSPHRESIMWRFYIVIVVNLSKPLDKSRVIDCDIWCPCNDMMQYMRQGSFWACAQPIRDEVTF